MTSKYLFDFPEFSRTRIIEHHFRVDSNKGESGIVYDVIIGYDLMVQLGLKDDFKRQVLQWNSAIVPMK